ncbi:metal ABC transporter substrate-binding protein [Mollicutes bacterium LVI A0039]|nr:metal ABC transporter substrate-binding protein [Mollicutes bacterium LVI A0039]
MKRIISTLLLLLTLAGCSNPANNEEQSGLNIVTTYYPYQLIIEELGGDFVNVSSIYPQDSDAHSYEVTPAQTIEMQDADLIVITNPEEDSKIYDSLNGKVEMLILDEDHEDEHEDEHEGEEAEGHFHSHSWLSPEETIEAVDLISSKLTALDEANSDAYQQTTAELIGKLEVIDQSYDDFAATQSKPIIATHDAYSTLAEQYGIEFVTLYGKHHDDEPTTKEVIDTVELIKSQDIKVIFVEQDDTANPIMRQIADETSSKVEVLYTLETQSSRKEFTSITDLYEYNLEMFKLGQNQ